MFMALYNTKNKHNTDTLYMNIILINTRLTKTTAYMINNS